MFHPGRTAFLSCVSVAAITCCAHAQHAGDIWVGVSAQGQLKIGGFNPAHHIIVLPPVTPGGLFRGWSGNSPGFDRVTADLPEADLYRLQSGASIYLELISADPALRAIDSGFQVLDTAGQRTFLGGSSLHVHLAWHLNSGDPRFDRRRCVWTAVFVLRDLGSTRYLVSEPLTLQFATHAPTPADFDCDGDVDADDYTHFQACALGPAIPQTDAACLDADLDNDGAVDQSDFGLFQRCFSGPDNPADPGCA